MYLIRDIEPTIKKAASSFQALFVFGARQVGKLTAMKAIFGDRFSAITLDDSDERALALSNPKGFLEVHPWPLIIDEVQKAPGLLSEIKIQIDEQRKKWLKANEPRELMYVLTGSNQFELQSGNAESLAGRAAIFSMASLSQNEVNGILGSPFNPQIAALLEKEKSAKAKYKPKKEVFEDIFRGGMPDIVTGNAEREIYLKSYFDTYIEKDILKLIAASSEMQFRRFVSYLALRTAQQVNYEVFARELGIDSATVKRWLSILATSGIITLLEPYMANRSNRIIKSPKLYFMDTGLCAYQCKWPNAEMLESGPMGGAFFETYVVSEMMKNLHNHGIDSKGHLYYYRDIDKKEIDLLYVEGEKIYPIEIKKSESPSNPTRNFKALLKYGVPIEKGLVIDTGDKIRPIGDGAYTLPIYLLGY